VRKVRGQKINQYNQEKMIWEIIIVDFLDILT